MLKQDGAKAVLERELERLIEGWVKGGKKPPARRSRRDTSLAFCQLWVGGCVASGGRYSFGVAE